MQSVCWDMVPSWHTGGPNINVEWMAKGYRKTGGHRLSAFPEVLKHEWEEPHLAVFLSVKLPERPTLLAHLWLPFALHSSERTKSWGHCFTLHLSLPKVDQWRLYISALKNKVSRTIYPRRLRSLFQELCFLKISRFNKKVPKKGSRSEVTWTSWAAGGCLTLEKL